MSDRSTLNVDPEAAHDLRRVVFQREGTLRGGVIHAAATEAVRDWVRKHDKEKA